MEKLVVKKDLVKITSDFVLGVILNEIIETAQRFRKEFIANKWHCPEFFEINIEKISEDNMLNLSKSSMRRYIKKLENLGFISIDKLEKKHKYRVNFNTINNALQQIGGSIIEKVKKVVNNDDNIEKNKKSENLDNINSCSQEDINEKEIAPQDDKELNKIISLIKNNIDYNTICKMRQDGKNEHFVNMYESIYKIIVDVMTSKSSYIRINKEEKHIAVVRSIFSKIDGLMVIDVIETLKRLNTKVVNFKNYVITTLYNTYLEKDFKLQNDLYRNAKIIL